MNDINKLIQMQSNLIDNMLAITEYIKNESKEKDSFCFSISEATDTLLKLATVFEKTQPKYITLESKGHCIYSDTDSLRLHSDDLPDILRRSKNDTKDK